MRSFGEGRKIDKIRNGAVFGYLWGSFLAHFGWPVFCWRCLPQQTRRIVHTMSISTKESWLVQNVRNISHNFQLWHKFNSKFKFKLLHKFKCFTAQVSSKISRSRFSLLQATRLWRHTRQNPHAAGFLRVGSLFGFYCFFTFTYKFKTTKIFSFVLLLC